MLRIAIPFGAGLLFIVPTLQALWLLGDLRAARFAGTEIDPTMSRRELLEELFGSGRFLTEIYPFHLWFLYYLIAFCLLLIPLIGLARLAAFDRIAGPGERLFRRLISARARVLLLAALTAGLLWPSQIRGIVDTQVFWAIKPHVFAYYFLFFLSGWMLWRHRDLLSSFTRHWGLFLLLGNLMIAPIFLLGAKAAAEARLGSGEMPGPIEGVVTCYVSALYTWMMVIGLMGAFQRFFDGHRAWVRYLADASYWCYLWHLTPIVALQLALERVPLFGPLKFLIIVGVSMTILLATYEWCVRYTFIGAVLNGRKHRMATPAASSDPITTIRVTQADGAVIEKC
jgi:peptidoglycan/LPS O-acetylase OafA/YrhL